MLCMLMASLFPSCSRADMSSMTPGLKYSTLDGSDLLDGGSCRIESFARYLVQNCLRRSRDEFAAEMEMSSWKGWIGDAPIGLPLQRLCNSRIKIERLTPS